MSELSFVKELLYSGKAKNIYTYKGSNCVLIQEFKDSMTAFNGEKKREVKGKGSINNQISSHIFRFLTHKGIKNHYIAKMNDDNMMMVRQVKIFPIEVVVRNTTSGSLCKKYGVHRGMKLESPILEYYYKDDKLGDPLVTMDHICAFGWISNHDDITKVIMSQVRDEALKINDLLKQFFLNINIELVDMKLEFGKDLGDGTTILADEISPDTCRLWDCFTKRVLDKDLFRTGAEDFPIIDAYQEVLSRIEGLNLNYDQPELSTTQG